MACLSVCTPCSLTLGMFECPRLSPSWERWLHLVTSLGDFTTHPWDDFTWWLPWDDFTWWLPTHPSRLSSQNSPSFVEDNGTVTEPLFSALQHPRHKIIYPRLLYLACLSSISSVQLEDKTGILFQWSLYSQCQVQSLVQNARSLSTFRKKMSFMNITLKEKTNKLF